MDILPKRKHNRLKEYDYCIPGYYFVTICVHNRIEKFGTINNSIGDGHARPVNKNKINNNLSVIVGSFKSAVTKRINQLNNLSSFKWQKTFYDHIIRIDESLNNIREYIINNPHNWELDKNNIKNYKVTVQACLNPTGQLKYNKNITTQLSGFFPQLCCSKNRLFRVFICII